MMLYILNLFDLVSTLIALSHGAVEMNPFMNFVIGVHPAVFAFVKTVLAYPLCMWLRDKQSYWFVCVVYAVVVANNLLIGVIL